MPVSEIDFGAGGKVSSLSQEPQLLSRGVVKEDFDIEAVARSKVFGGKLYESILKDIEGSACRVFRDPKVFMDGVSPHLRSGNPNLLARMLEDLSRTPDKFGPVRGAVGVAALVFDPQGAKDRQEAHNSLPSLVAKVRAAGVQVNNDVNAARSNYAYKALWDCRPLLMPSKRSMALLSSLYQSRDRPDERVKTRAFLETDDGKRALLEAEEFRALASDIGKGPMADERGNGMVSFHALGAYLKDRGEEDQTIRIANAALYVAAGALGVVDRQRASIEQERMMQRRMEGRSLNGLAAQLRRGVSGRGF